MKIVHVLRKYHPDEWGGTETALQRLFLGLQREPVQSVIFAPKLSSPAQNADPFHELGCEVKRFKACVPIWGVSEEVRNQMVAVGGNLFSFDLFPRLWKEKNLSLIHTHTLGRIGGIAKAVAERRGVPLVVSIHGGLLDLPEQLKAQMNTPRGQGWEWGKIFGALLRSRRILHDADAILTCNHKEAGLLRESYPDKRVVVQPHGIPLSRYTDPQMDAALESFPALKGREILLCVGRVDEVKNQKWLIRSSEVLLREFPRMSLVMVGACTDQEYGASLRKLMEASPVSSQISWLGGLPPGDPRLIGLLQLARALVIPSVSETFGLVILEAWASGAPVLSSRTSGGQGLIEHSSNGWLFDLERPESYQAGVRRYWNEPPFREAMARAGYETATHYDLHTIALQVKTLYGELIEKKEALRSAAGRRHERVHAS